MQVLIQGKFIANESRTNRETGDVIDYAIVLAGNETVKIKDLFIKDKKQLDDVEVAVNLTCFDSRIYCTAVR